MKFTVNVTAEHIAEAIKDLNEGGLRTLSCPIAKALCDHLVTPSVTTKDAWGKVRFKDGHVMYFGSLPDQAVQFIADFDSEKTVAPFSFEFEGKEMK